MDASFLCTECPSYYFRTQSLVQAAVYLYVGSTSVTAGTRVVGQKESSVQLNRGLKFKHTAGPWDRGLNFRYTARPWVELSVYSVCKLKFSQLTVLYRLLYRLYQIPSFTQDIGYKYEGEDIL